jgi:hypothetical protein
MEFPIIEPVPAVGLISPSNIRMVVVFPEPFGPTNPQIVPSGTSNVAFSTAAISPYRLLRFSTAIAGVLMEIPSHKKHSIITELTMSNLEFHNEQASLGLSTYQ